MIRLNLLWLLVAFLAAYAWRDWYKSLCGLVLLMAVYQHPDFPTSLMGVQGLNPWNILLFVIFVAWAASRKREGLKWDMPTKVNWYLIFYLAIILISFIRLIDDTSRLDELEIGRGNNPTTFFGLFSEYVVNCVKWIVPGLLLFDGCRSEKRFRLALMCLLGVYILLAVQVIRWMPLANLMSGSEMAERAHKLLSNEVGYHRVNLSMMLAGASWAIFTTRALVSSKWVVLFIYFSCAVVFLGMALTGGRTGYITWLVVGLVFGYLKWRKVFVLAPAVFALVIFMFPAAQERFSQGFTPDTIDTNVQIEELAYLDEGEPDLYTITSGRTFIWPFVIDQIGQAPLTGYGREAMLTTGLGMRIWEQYKEGFQHPHNAYLQWTLDNGLIGLVPVLLFYVFIWRASASLFTEKNDVYCIVVGGVTMALVTALLVASTGSQTFYPREGSVGMWCAIGLMLRVYIQRELWRNSKMPDGASANSKSFWGTAPSRKRVVRWPNRRPEART